MRGLIILANGFEDAEAIITIDLLRRAHLELDLVSMGKVKEVLTSRGIYITADKTIHEVNLNDYDYLIIPGGKAVFDYHLKSPMTKSIVEFFMKRHALVACICAAPMILGSLGYLKGIKYTCFPGCENDSFGGIYTNSEVEVTGNIITSKAMGTTFAFGYEIIKYLLDKEMAIKVINEVYYQKETQNN